MLEAVPVLSAGDTPQGRVPSTRRSDYPVTAEALTQTELWGAALQVWGCVGGPDGLGWGDGLSACRRCVLRGESALPRMELPEVSSLCDSGDAEKEIDWIFCEILQVQMLDPLQMY